MQTTHFITEEVNNGFRSARLFMKRIYTRQMYCNHITVCRTISEKHQHIISSAESVGEGIGVGEL